jgi:GNAT superfamily N-acetyltransferase
MGIAQQNLPITMARHNLEGIPRYPLPTGYSLRGYHPGDERLWREIHILAERYATITPELFEQEFGRDEAALTKRQLYLLNQDGKEIGTATAWFDDDYRGQAFGRVHWVALAPQYQGKGLAKPLMAAVCLRLRGLGHQRAYLVTSTARVPAVRLYLRFGFIPWPEGAADVRVWRQLESELGLTHAARRQSDGTPVPSP